MSGVMAAATLRLPHGQGQEREQSLQDFAAGITEISESVGFKMSARGWCYLLEGLRLINKDQFDRVESAINTCRETGLIPIDFTAEEEGRKFSGIEDPDTGDAGDLIERWLGAVATCERYYTPDWWEGERYYIQMLVEKIDLKTLFEPVCKKYFIPIATAKGWASMLQRAEYARRFADAEKRGLTCVLLYAGDHDPDGLRISEHLRNNLVQLKNIVWEDGTEGYDPENLIIERFGLNYDFIIDNDLTWINNLITGSGKNLANPGHKNYHMEYVQQYLKTVGARKCEANAIVKNAAMGRQLCTEAIERFLNDGTTDSDDDALNRFRIKRERVDRYIRETRKNVKVSAGSLDDAIQEAIKTVVHEPLEPWDPFAENGDDEE